jgi:hypothetical protein
VNAFGQNDHIVKKASPLAKQNDRVITQAFPVDLSMIQGGGYARNQGGYGQRVDLEAYQVGIPSETGGDFRASGTNVYDDATFAGPYTSNATPLVLNGMSLGFNLPTVFPSPNGDHMYTRVTFYANHDGPTVPAGTNPYSGATVVSNLDWGAGWTTGATPGSVRYYPSSVTFGATIATLSNADVFAGGPTDRTAGVKIETYADAAFTIRPTDWALSRRGLFTACKVGSTDPFGWLSNAAIVPTGEIPNSTDGTTRSGGPDATNARGTFMGFQGTGFTIAPPNPTDLGTLADGTTNRTGITVADNTVAWFKIVVPALGGIDGNGTFVDIDTEGSTGDLAVAVYDGNSAAATFGNVAAFDRDSGSGTQGQLSFGMGRRAAVADGRQYDGRNAYNGAAGLAAGTYYVAIAPNGSTFANGFSVTATGTGGTGQLHFSTNATAGALAASVAPVPIVGDDLIPNPLVAPGAQIVSTPMNAGDPRWLRFATCQAADAVNTVTLNWAGTSSAGFSATLFDNSGNFVFQEVFAGAGQPPNVVFDGVTNVLPAGTYYLAMTYAAVQTQPNSPTTNGRWHLRSTQQNNGFAGAGEIDVVNQSCAPAGGCTADFNCDGDIGTDADISAFFACLSGTCPAAPCANTADFNNDGDVGTDGDIASFFRVLSGGPC